MKKLRLTLAALTLLLLLTGCAPKEEDGEKDSYIVIHSIEGDTDTKVTPDHRDYDALLDGLFDAAGEAVGTTTVLSEDAVQTATVTYYQAPTRTVLGGGDGAYAPILSFDLYDDGGEPYAKGYFSADEERKLTLCFPLPAELDALVDGWVSGGGEDAGGPGTSDRPEKLHEDVGAETVRYVTISGDAKSIVIRQGEGENFAFYNGDLNAAHTYTVQCSQREEALDIVITMENPEADNDVLGSPIIDIPRKEFEKLEIAGDFAQVSLSTIHSDVWIRASDSLVNLDVEADRLDHDITLDGSEDKTFRGVSVYFDTFPENIRMELNVLPGGKINDPQSLLEENGLAAGTEKPVIRISRAEEINIYSME